MTMLTSQAIEIRAALVAIKVEGVKGKTKMKLARNIALLDPVCKEFEEQRSTLARSLAGSAATVPADKMQEYVTGVESLKAHAEDITLFPLDEAELNLDANATPPEALAILLGSVLKTRPETP